MSATTTTRPWTTSKTTTSISIKEDTTVALLEEEREAFSVAVPVVIVILVLAILVILFLRLLYRRRQGEFGNVEEPRVRMGVATSTQAYNRAPAPTVQIQHQSEIPSISRAVEIDKPPSYEEAMGDRNMNHPPGIARQPCSASMDNLGDVPPPSYAESMEEIPGTSAAENVSSQSSPSMSATETSASAEVLVPNNSNTGCITSSTNNHDSGAIESNTSPHHSSVCDPSSRETGECLSLSSAQGTALAPGEHSIDGDIGEASLANKQESKIHSSPAGMAGVSDSAATSEDVAAESETPLVHMELNSPPHAGMDTPENIDPGTPPSVNGDQGMFSHTNDMGVGSDVDAHQQSFSEIEINEHDISGISTEAFVVPSEAELHERNIPSTDL